MSRAAQPPQFTIRERPLFGTALGTEWLVFHAGQFVGARLSHISDDEALDMVRQFLKPPPPPVELPGRVDKDTWRSGKGASTSNQRQRSRTAMADVFDEET